MEDMLHFTTILILTLTAVAGVWYLLDYLYAPKPLPNEPPSVSPSIPYIGHILGLLQHGTRYYETIRYTPTSTLIGASGGEKLNTHILLVLGASCLYTL